MSPWLHSKFVFNFRINHICCYTPVAGGSTVTSVVKLVLLLLLMTFYSAWVHARTARGKAIGVSVGCLSSAWSISIKISKSQHLGESRVNKDSEKTPSVSFLTLGNTQESYKLCKYVGHAYIGHAHLLHYEIYYDAQDSLLWGVYCACSSFWSWNEKFVSSKTRNKPQRIQASKMRHGHINGVILP